MVEIRQTDQYARWFKKLKDPRVKAKIDIRIRRLSLGNPGDAEPIGKGLSELRIDYGIPSLFYETGRRVCPASCWR